ncbi:hypothetical protein LF599_17110 [Pseudodesulfovibrio thermohalotolerans]|uniref:hypothetical protein n=1 Tax=Pseudodesulfovibrio thermohalotolerans TaxID=2880651 RepID=UPI002441D3EF|nr:hypothetical protein [Pseudodesulfovibrio thermohalotolerans]WFS62358.1 hypothetical protein LF599_17110 [Pseudodesulfovibrio thermohalotolerans]
MSKTPIEMREAIVALRKANPGQGPRKIAGEFRARGLKAPSPCTIAVILEEEGLTRQRRKRNACFRQWPGQLTVPDHPNHVWTVDYKGWNMRQQTRLMRSWRRIYNHRRGHEALGMAVPASRYARSVRQCPPIIPDFQYDADVVVRRVKRSGEILWAGKMRYINQGLRGCTVGLLENQNRDMNVYAGSVLLGF